MPDCLSLHGFGAWWRETLTRYPGTPIGRILVLQGYLSQNELARMIAQQQNFRRVFCVTLDNRLAPVVSVPREAAAQDSAASAAVPEMASFTATELDTNPLFGITR
jgi:hypothetical protein